LERYGAAGIPDVEREREEEEEKERGTGGGEDKRALGGEWRGAEEVDNAGLAGYADAADDVDGEKDEGVTEDIAANDDDEVDAEEEEEDEEEEKLGFKRDVIVEREKI
jgi:hypothetical protein